MNFYVLDTSVILSNPNVINNLGKNYIIIPSVVLEELDSKKRLSNEIGANAREFSRQYIKLRGSTEGDYIKLDNGGKLIIELNNSDTKVFKGLFSGESNDNRILAVATNFATDVEKLGQEVHLLTSDYLLIAKADAVIRNLGLRNLKAELYDLNNISADTGIVYKGYKEVYLSEGFINKLYQEGKVELDNISKEIHSLNELDEELYVGEFLICVNPENDKQTFHGRIVDENGVKFLRKVLSYSKEQTLGISPRKGNIHQSMFYDLLFDQSTELVTVIGNSGTGKTLLTLAASVSQISQSNLYDRFLIARPTIAMGNDPGALPGDLGEKIDPWMKPIYDNLEFIYNNNSGNKMDGKGWKKAKDIIEDLGFIEIEVLAYIRGRTLPRQIIYIDEAQNLTPIQAKTIITRAGEGTKVIFAGDPTQIDHPYLDTHNNGLVYVTDRMKDLPNFGTITIEKVERSNLAKLASERL